MGLVRSQNSLDAEAASVSSHRRSATFSEECTLYSIPSKQANKQATTVTLVKVQYLCVLDTSCSLLACTVPSGSGIAGVGRLLGDDEVMCWSSKPACPARSTVSSDAQRTHRDSLLASRHSRSVATALASSSPASAAETPRRASSSRKHPT